MENNPKFRLDRTKEYRLWSHIKDRCYNPKDKFFHRYGGRGISICDKWKYDFWKFVEDIGYAPTPKHTLDRIDNDGNYEPENVRWVTQKEQANNRSGIRLRKITFRGETKNLSDWAKFLNINHKTLSGRIDKLGWSVEDALSSGKSHRFHRVKIS